MQNNDSEKPQMDVKKAQQEQKKRRPYVRTDIIILLVMIILFLIFAWQWPHRLYRGGLENSGPPLIMFEIFSYTLYGAVALLVLAVRFLVQFRRATTIQLTLKLVLIGVAVFIVGLPFFYIRLNDQRLASLPAFVPFTHGFLECMKQDADIESIRAWLETEDHKFERGYSSLDESEYPEAILNLEPRNVFIHKDKDTNGIYMKLEWGGVMTGHWGITIGDKMMRCPPCDFGMEGEYRVPVAEGAYIWFRF